MTTYLNTAALNCTIGKYYAELLTVQYSALVGATQADKCEDLRATLQTYMDDVIAIADLPVGDPDKTTDPADAGCFWDSGNLISRSCTVTVWYDTNYQVKVQRL